MGHDLCFRLLLKPEVDRRLIAERDSSEHLHGLMILEYLHSTDILSLKIFGNDPVGASGKIVALDIEPVDIRTLILDFSTSVHIETGHTVHHLAYRSVLLTGELTYGISHRITILTYTLGSNAHLLELPGLDIELHSERVGSVDRIERIVFGGKAHTRYL